MGGSREDLRGFPPGVRREVGFALHFAQAGGKHPSSKPLKGFGGAGVLEVVADFRGGACRAVYTVRFGDAGYVLHTFQKKSKRGTATPRREMALIRERLRWAEEDHRAASGR
ncbi:MAG: type II toxin-antitoxin system RelE/ParE family toxin [Nitrospinota bacterium]